MKPKENVFSEIELVAQPKNPEVFIHIYSSSSALKLSDLLCACQSK